MFFAFVFFGRTASMINVGLTSFLHTLSHPGKQAGCGRVNRYQRRVQPKTSSPHAETTSVGGLINSWNGPISTARLRFQDKQAGTITTS